MTNSNRLTPANRFRMTQINITAMEDNTLNIDDFASQFAPAGLSAHPEVNDIMVVGVGGGGGNAVNHMYQTGVKGVTFVVLNTDARALEKCDVPNKVVIGNGRGAGNNPAKAKKAAEEGMDKIERLFTGDTRMVFITAGMGGGTGTGAGPVVARVAKEKGLLTIGIVTIPFIFEGDKKIMKALEGADEMARHVDALLIINNQRLTEIYPELSFFNAFAKADETLTTAASSISEIITTTGFINVDFEDVDCTLRDGGTAIISTGYGEGENRVTKAIEDALNSPLLRNRDIFGSRSLLLNLYMSSGGDNAVAMSEIDELRRFVADINPDVDIIWGVTADDSLGDQVKITVLAAGFDVTLREEEDELMAAHTAHTRVPAAEPSGASRPAKQPSDIERKMRDLYGDTSDISNNYIILSPAQMNDDSVIEILEQPALTRDKKVVENLRRGVMPETLRADVREEKTEGSKGGQIEFIKP